MYKLVLGIAALALSAGTASAQWVYPGYGYAPYGYGYAPYGYGYAGITQLQLMHRPRQERRSLS